MILCNGPDWLDFLLILSLHTCVYKDLVKWLRHRGDVIERRKCTASYKPYMLI